VDNGNDTDNGDMELDMEKIIKITLTACTPVQKFSADNLGRGNLTFGWTTERHLASKILNHQTTKILWRTDKTEAEYRTADSRLAE